MDSSSEGIPKDREFEYVYEEPRHYTESVYLEICGMLKPNDYIIKKVYEDDEGYKISYKVCYLTQLGFLYKATYVQKHIYGYETYKILYQHYKHPGIDPDRFPDRIEKTEGFSIKEMKELDTRKFNAKDFPQLSREIDFAIKSLK